jgi:hypothetical protein
MAKEKLTGRVSYRLGGEEFRQIQRLAAAKDLSPDDWCREAAREKLAAIRAQTARGQAGSQVQGQPTQPAPPSQSQGQKMTVGELILFQELIRLRWLFQTSLRYFGKDGLTVEGWNYLSDQANRLDGQARKMAEDWLVTYGVLKPKS